MRIRGFCLRKDARIVSDSSYRCKKNQASFDKTMLADQDYKVTVIRNCIPGDVAKQFESS